jgi:thiol-disulfide isomerase/thioredoxin
MNRFKHKSIHLKMASEKKVITELTVSDLKDLQNKMKTHVLIIKFGADWCGPCKKIAPLYYEFINNSVTSNIIFADIDVDENLDLYMALKKQKMVTGIPVFLAFWGGVKRDMWYIPDDSVIGADEKQVTEFFKRCASKANNEGYSYYSG